ncbi:MAG: thermonuclease family protein, partial [Candidatus Omnitrophica bacterium]|nr:thermonuclease family protein [Candidatus Omnitrophota bacterium]
MNRIFNIVILIGILLLPALFFISRNHAEVIYNKEQGKFTIPFGRSYDYSDIYVTRVVDGDTLKLENGERVRLIGIDTPEMHDSDKLYRDARRTKQDIQTIKAMGRRAYNFTRTLVEGKQVRLEFDVERYDRYGRLLAYVFLKDSGAFVNAEIIKQGYASVMTYPPNVEYADLFLKLYQQARQDKR